MVCPRYGTFTGSELRRRRREAAGDKDVPWHASVASVSKSPGTRAAQTCSHLRNFRGRCSASLLSSWVLMQLPCCWSAFCAKSVSVLYHRCNNSRRICGILRARRSIAFFPFCSRDSGCSFRCEGMAAGMWHLDWMCWQRGGLQQKTN